MADSVAPVDSARVTRAGVGSRHTAMSTGDGRYRKVRLTWAFACRSVPADPTRDARFRPVH